MWAWLLGSPPKAPPSAPPISGGNGVDSRRMWVRAMPQPFMDDAVPGIDEGLLSMLRVPSGSPEEKLQCTISAFKASARHAESLQQVFLRRAFEKRTAAGKSVLPADVVEAIQETAPSEAFLSRRGGEQFVIHAEEIVPYHEYVLVLKIRAQGSSSWAGGGAAQEAAIPRRPDKGAAATGHCYMLAWHWRHLPDQPPHDLPSTLHIALAAEGNDPLAKLRAALQDIRAWETRTRPNTAYWLQASPLLSNDPYVREVLRLWPCEGDPAAWNAPRNCAAVEGLDPELFVGRAVKVCRVPYDSLHALVLQARITKRCTHFDNEPPFQLELAWDWDVNHVGGCGGGGGGSGGSDSHTQLPSSAGCHDLDTQSSVSPSEPSLFASSLASETLSV
eukprot:NODE_8305_length_1506_cov_5.167513.p1 GENE.NODE_8305_length_1506_cov_5.167513~~NODE_8305_length_1506_cov_5.167513.p1  ORF type:complete len:389 (-),score=135.96 NODE_8305_length_1506_cov_5.167513:259-1425(-)